MRILIDECLHDSLVRVAHGAGFEATHVNHLGLNGKPDWELAERIAEDEFTFVTNNRIDFISALLRDVIARRLNRNRPERCPVCPARYVPGGHSISGRERVDQFSN